MRKTRIATMALLFLILGVALMPVMQPTKAYDYGYGAASELYSSDWLLTEHDIDQVNYAFPQIYGFFENQISYWTSDPIYGHLWNFAHQTITGNLINQLRDCDLGHSYATFFYYGHYAIRNIGLDWPEYSYGFHEQAAPSAAEPPVIWDNGVIFNNTWSGNFYFVFLWVCEDGRIQGGWNPPHGMPFCWTKHILSPDGYGTERIPGNPDGDSYCFIGFEGASPCLNEEMGTIYQGVDNIYKFWLVFFYFYALEGQLSIKDSLDAASEACLFYGGLYDEENPLTNETGFWWPGGAGHPEGYYWGRIRVYGNAENSLPFSGFGVW